ncbi:MAG TPA: S9 family peptidase [Thermoanaerobaculia bacterium]|nr:S9 family peptidase [Thermoanaerobaculia bacterium]
MKRILTLALLAFVATVVSAQRPMTYEDLAAMKRIGSPKLSPDGKWIAYDVTTTDLAANKRNTAVWLMRADGSGAKELTAGSVGGWSPDGKSLALTTGGQIALYDVAAGTTTKLQELPGGASTIKWVPDGSALIATSDIHPDCGLDAKCIAEKEKAPASKARVIDSLLYRHWMSWQAPTRSHILYVPLRGAARDLTPGPYDAPHFSVGGGDEFDISPDGKELVFARNTDANPERSTNSDLFVVNTSGGDAKRITSRTGADTSPLYSPDGRYIAYRSQARNSYESDLFELWLYDRAAGTSKRIASDFNDWIDSAVWSPDSKTLLVTSGVKARHLIYEVTLDGRMTQVTKAGSADSIVIAPDGKTLYFSMSTLRRPSDIHSMSRSGTPVQLTHHNDALLAQLTMGAVEELTWKGADDATVQGWLVKPPNFDATKKYPAIVLIHGGPQGAWADSWSYRWNPQMWVARGYVVLMPNPRGSTSFGQQFVEQISQDWGGSVYTDLMNGVDVFAQLPYVDANRTGAAGASYGGYMINWILGHTNRFKALVSHDGVYNLESMWGATEELWFPEWEFGGTPWEQPEQYEKWSPHRFAKNFTTPTLVVHGELDYRVPLDQGLQLFTALQRRGVPSRLLLFPDEGHWVLKPQNSKVWHETVLGWMDSYLKK